MSRKKARIFWSFEIENGRLSVVFDIALRKIV